MLKFTRLPPQLCPYCGSVLDAATPSDRSDAGPSPADLTVCFTCAEPLIFGNDLKPERITPEAMREIARQEPELLRTLQRMQDAIRNIPKDA